MSSSQDRQIEFIRFVSDALENNGVVNPNLLYQLQVIRAGKAAIKWVESTGDCLFCHFKDNNLTHEEYCPLKEE